MRTHLLLVPALVIGCADDPRKDDIVVMPQEDIPSHWTEWIPETPARDMRVSFTVSTVSCDAPIALLEGGAHYTDDFSPVPNVTCQYVFEDGTTADGCVVEHEFPIGGVAHPVTLIVTDPASGTVLSEEVFAFVYPPLVASLEASAPVCGLELSWTATVETSAETHVFVDPFDKIITSDPLYHLNRIYTLQVSEPGVYTVRLEVEDERETGGICQAQITKEVTVVACGDDGEHEHGPDCEDMH